MHTPCVPLCPAVPLPKVLAIPVLTLEVLTWLMRFSCSGFTSTTTLMFHRDCMATCGCPHPQPPASRCWGPLGPWEPLCVHRGCSLLLHPTLSHQGRLPRESHHHQSVSTATQHQETNPKYLVSVDLEHPQPPSTMRAPQKRQRHKARAQPPPGHRASHTSTTHHCLHPTTPRVPWTPWFLPGGTQPL